MSKLCDLEDRPCSFGLLPFEAKAYGAVAERYGALRRPTGTLRTTHVTPYSAHASSLSRAGDRKWSFPSGRIRAMIIISLVSSEEDYQPKRRHGPAPCS